MRTDALSRLGRTNVTETRLSHEALDRLTSEIRVVPVFVSPCPDKRAWGQKPNLWTGNILAWYTHSHHLQ